MRRAVETPCPISANRYEEVEDTFSEDTTANLDYTTAFKASFRNVRPKRATAARRGPATFVIHEDGAEAEAAAIEVEHNVKKPLSRLSQPAKRVAVAATRQATTSKSISHAKDAQFAGKSHVARVRGTSVVPDENQGVITRGQQHRRNEATIEEPAQRKGVMDQSRRRNTLYIPQEDTMQPTMWMGIFSPVKNVAPGESAEDLTGIAAQMAEKRKRGSSSFQPKAKRGPLQMNPTAQGKATQVDHAGAPTGKENLPPGHVKKTIDDVKPVLEECQTTTRDRDAERRKFLTKARLENLARPKSSSSNSDVLSMYEVGTKRQVASSPKRVAWNAGPRAVPLSPIPRSRNSSCATSPVQTARSKIEPTTVPSRFVRTSLRQSVDINPQLSILEDIKIPSMYEDNWLEQQEIAITQILNSLFEQAHSGSKIDQKDTRSKLLEKYNSPENNILYSKLQGALLYGSLSLTYESMLHVQGLNNDVGRKQQFLRFWLDNYDHQLLKLALEVVTGRQCSSQKRTSSPNGKSSNRATLSRFIETSLLRHEEAHFKVSGTGSSVNDLGTKTVLKSLMLVKALDMLKETGPVLVDRRLFRCNATIKTSANAAKEVMTMLNSSIGDCTRTLRQLGYTVSHEQSTLDDIEYRVENLAVDFRDGTLLTRLVEIMLYGTTNTMSNNDTQTITIPDGEELLVARHKLRPLSEHLKLPCNSRTVKLRNTQVAMAALANVASLEPVMKDVTAEHIVDGHREKTITLLWSLVSGFGLAGFIDRNDMVQEIRRLDRGRNIDDLMLARSGRDQLSCEYLLKEWARTVAASRGLQVRNFSTSFSDGKVFEAIVDEYESYLLPSTEIANAVPLHQRLARLGCSKQFSRLFAIRGDQLHIFGKDFVIAALAFLCSRVLGPSRLFRKAVIIQRCWRRHWQSVQAERRAIKHKLALACAASVSDALVSFNDEDHATCQDSDIWLGL